MPRATSLLCWPLGVLLGSVGLLCLATPPSVSPPAGSSQYAMPAPLSPQDSVAALATKPGLKVELVASEPLIADPVAIDWGIDGRLWVLEMGDYPNGIAVDPTRQKEVDAHHGAAPTRPGGRLKFLEDTNGDGTYDRATLFLDGLPYPTGIQCWRDGVLIAAAPDVIYAEDTNGDGRADIRKILCRGFGEGNQQHRVNGLRWGLDNWLYLGNGDSGGEIESVAPLLPESANATPPAPAVGPGGRVKISGRDLRIRPDEGLLDPIAGQTQFGRERDDWGNWFGNNNSRPMFHYVYDDVYLRRNSRLAVRDTRVEVPEIPGASPVYPRSKTLSRFNDFDRANRFTSACSTIVYRDTLLGEEFAGNSFTCEPVHNLVSRAILSPVDETFHSRRANDEKQSEFLASTDNWFRPVMVRTGPDGALWVVDMYRMVIEHPEWIPEDWKQQLNLRAGEDTGRIYRILPAAAAAQPGRERDLKLLPPEKSLPKSVAAISAERLLGMLSSPNGWQRDTAQRLLVHRQERSAAPALERLANSAEEPQTRVQALCTLDGLHALQLETVIHALGDAHPGVRRHAIRLSEQFAAARPEMLVRLLSLAGDGDPFVRQQLAYTLGVFSGSAANDAQPRIAGALAQLLLASPRDAYLRQSALTSFNDRNARLTFETLLTTAPPAAMPDDALAELAGMAAALSSREDRVALLFQIADRKSPGAPETWRLQAAARLLKELKSPDAPLRQQLQADAALQSLWQQAESVAVNSQSSLELRLAAIEFLGMAARVRGQAGPLAQLLSPAEPTALQTAAVTALAESGDPGLPSFLLRGWESHTPALRTQIIQTLLQRPVWTGHLLDALTSGAVRGGDLDAAARERLASHPDPSLRERAAALLAKSVDPARAQVVARYQDAAALPGDAPSGRQLFEKKCANCHLLGGLGRQVGADLSALTDKSPQALLIAILDPNRAVEAKYRTYLAIDKDGRVFTGMLAAETSTSITLVSSDVRELLLLRRELEELKCTEKSLMPEGLENDLSVQNMADLIAFVANKATPPKQFPGNRPAGISPDREGVLTLSSRNAEIHGPTLIYEGEYRNLGYWQSADDYASWTVNLPKAGRYRASMTYACDDSTAGGTLQLSASGATCAAKIPGTGAWNSYQTAPIGEINLPPGKSVIVARAQGAIPRALLDLHALQLTPIE